MSGDDSFTELGFETTDATYPVVGLVESLDCRADLLEFLQTERGGLTLFLCLRDDDVDGLSGRARRADADLDVLETTAEEVLVEYRPSASVVGTLARQGVIPESATAADGVARVTGVAPPTRDCRRVVERVTSDHPSMEFTGKRHREVVAPLVTEQGVRSLFGSRLTDRQWEAVRLAYERGYFDEPQRHSQTDLAEEMGISQKTFSQHLNAAQRKLLSVVFEA
ncbi:MAG: bacterio-opsin activator domain-containing protein [Halobacterium sp.]